MEDEDNEVSTVIAIVLLILSVTFFLLKIFGAIHWSWWYVTSPLWSIPAIGIIQIFIYFLFHVLGYLYGLIEKGFNDGRS